MRKRDRSQAATERATESDWLTFTLVGVVLAVTQMSYYLTAAALPLYLRDLGAAPSRIGLLITGVMTDLSNLSSEANRGAAMSTGGGSLSAAFFLGGTVSGVLIGPGGFDAVLAVGAVSCLLAVPFVLAERGMVARSKHAV